MNTARSVIAARRNRIAMNATIQTKESITARAFAKAVQIETCDSSRNRTMWTLLK